MVEKVETKSARNIDNNEDKTGEQRIPKKNLDPEAHFLSLARIFSRVIGAPQVSLQFDLEVEGVGVRWRCDSPSLWYQIRT